MIGNNGGHSYGDNVVILTNEGRNGHLYLHGDSVLRNGDAFPENRKHYLSEKDVRPATDQEIDDLFEQLKPNGINHVVKLLESLSLT